MPLVSIISLIVLAERKRRGEKKANNMIILQFLTIYNAFLAEKPKSIFSDGFFQNFYQVIMALLTQSSSTAMMLPGLHRAYASSYEAGKAETDPCAHR